MGKRTRLTGGEVLHRAFDRLSKAYNPIIIETIIPRNYLFGKPGADVEIAREGSDIARFYYRVMGIFHNKNSELKAIWHSWDSGNSELDSEFVTDIIAIDVSERLVERIKQEVIKKIRKAKNFRASVAYSKTDGGIYLPKNPQNPYREAVQEGLTRYNIPFFIQDETQEQQKARLGENIGLLKSKGQYNAQYNPQTVDKFALLLEQILLNGIELRSNLPAEPQKETDVQDIWHPRTDFPE